MGIRITILCGLAGALLVLPAAAATTIRGQGSGGANTMYIEPGHVAMRSGAEGHALTIFDAAKDRMLLVDRARHTYQVMDAQRVQKLADQMQQMRKQLEQQLQKLPESQRAAMRKQMGSMMPGAAKPPTVRIERGGSDRVNGFACTQAKVFLDGQARHEVCVASLDALGLSKAEYQTLTGMFAFFGKMYGKVSAGAAQLGPRTTERLMQELGGLPVRSKDLQSGKSWQIRDVSHDAIPANTFQVPAGYREEDGFGG